jgi:hypothetical protein
MILGRTTEVLKTELILDRNNYSAFIAQKLFGLTEKSYYRLAALVV